MACGPTTFWLLYDLARLKALSKYDYDQLLELAKAHLIPEQSVSVQWYRFNSRNHHQGETISSYIAEPKRLTEQCHFRDSLGDMLHDRLVCDTNDQAMLRQLLAEKNLAFNEVLQLIQAVEAAESNIHNLHTP